MSRRRKTHRCATCECTDRFRHDVLTWEYYITNGVIQFGPSVRLDRPVPLNPHHPGRLLLEDTRCTQPECGNYGRCYRCKREICNRTCPMKRTDPLRDAVVRQRVADERERKKMEKTNDEVRADRTVETGPGSTRSG